MIDDVFDRADRINYIRGKAEAVGFKYHMLNIQGDLVDYNNLEKIYKTGLEEAKEIGLLEPTIFYSLGLSHIYAGKLYFGTEDKGAFTFIRNELQNILKQIENTPHENLEGYIYYTLSILASRVRSGQVRFSFYLNNAIKYSTINNDHITLGFALKDKANFLGHELSYEELLGLLNKSELAFKEFGVNYYLMDVYQLLFLVHRISGDYENAYNYAKLAETIGKEYEIPTATADYLRSCGQIASYQADHQSAVQSFILEVPERIKLNDSFYTTLRAMHHVTVDEVTITLHIPLEATPCCSDICLTGFTLQGLPKTFLVCHPHKVLLSFRVLRTQLSRELH